MFSKLISRSAQFHSAAKGKLFFASDSHSSSILITCWFQSLANVKFPEGTVAGMYKAAVAAKPDYDIVRVDSQKINWTLKELDVSYYSHLFSCP